ncbi:MAG TPA: fumarylacetoacetate hydrolase family protein [Chloroflexota bacterium]|nr:fumarylacetoacetate hydrolase family protein [Chloroflexota bacterium]
MRLLMYREAGVARPGVVVGEEVVDLAALARRDGSGADVPPASDLAGVIDRGQEGLASIRSRLAAYGESHELSRPLAELDILAPLDPPRGNVVCIGRNYEEHAAESARARGESMQRPTVFTKAQTTITGPFADIRVDPAISAEIDWEAELGVVIGRRGINIRREDALDYVFGYTVVNDVSARDIQHNWGGQFFKGKSIDGYCPIGPWIVTADEVPDPQALQVRLRVNGETKQDAGTRDMIFPVDELIAQLSLGMTLLPGTLIATGTPAGVGFARTPPEFLRPGDVMETEVMGIGTLRNPIVGI